MREQPKSKQEKVITFLISIIVILLTLMIILFFPFRPKNEEKTEDSETVEGIAEAEQADVSEDENIPSTGLAYETAKDGEIDFVALQQENPDIFAWIYVPGTNIDYPVLQSEEADDFYETHDAFGQSSEAGAVYTELANLKNMCDFNTVIHGKSLSKAQEQGLFSELTQFANPDFFQKNENIYLYLPDNVLTYEIFAAYEREDTSLIRTYDFTYLSGCQQFLDNLYDTRTMGKNIREEWEGVTPYHFLITLTTKSKANSDKQYVVIGAMVGDAAGKIDRVVDQ